LNNLPDPLLGKEGMKLFMLGEEPFNLPFARGDTEGYW
jgi:hypothetical protein